MNQSKAWPLYLLPLVLGLSACSLQTSPLAPKAPQIAAPSLTAVTPTPAQLQQFEQAKQHLTAGDAAEATALLQPLFAALPQAPGIGYNLAVSQWRSGNITGAQQTLSQVVGVAPHYSDAHNLSGVMARQQGHFRQAERHFQRALQAQADYATAHKNLAFLYELYLGEVLQAHYHYQQYYALTQDEQAKVWLALLDQQLAQEQSNE
jgi:Flp pilus assembly protein TadD